MSSAKKTILVTGASGFVGKVVCADLAERGYLVVPATRNEIGDLEQGQHTPWAKLLRGVDGVVHLAALVHRPELAENDALYFRINTDATRALAQEAVRFGVKSFVFLSSVKVMGESTQSGHPWNEGDEPHPQDAYGRSKLAAEQSIGKAIEQSNCMAFCLRSPLVYGSGVKANFKELMRLAARGIPLPLGLVQNERSLVSVWNLSQAVVEALEKGFTVPLGSGRAGVRTYFVSDGKPVSTAELYEKMSKALGKKARVLKVSPRLLAAAAGFFRKQGAFQKVAGNLAVDSSRIQSELGYRPRLSLEQSLERMIAETETTK